MANTINIPALNAIKLVSLNSILEFSTPNFDESLFADQLLNWQTKKDYAQKFQNNDTIYFQFNANFAPVTASLIDCTGNVAANATITTIATGALQPNYYAYGCLFDLTGIEEGRYWVKLYVGSDEGQLVAISEPIDIAAFHEDTMLFKYSHSENTKGAIFQNGEAFSLRVESALLEFQLGSEDVIAEDELADLVILSSVIFRSWKLYIGKGAGVPNWVADKIIRIFSCDNVKINGTNFTKTEGGKLERSGNNNSPLSGWKLDVRESKARDGLTIENNIPLYEHIDIIYVPNTSMFGAIGSATSSIIVKE